MSSSRTLFYFAGVMRQTHAGQRAAPVRLPDARTRTDPATSQAPSVLPTTGMESCVAVSAARMCAGMSSGPSTVCRYRRLSSGTSRPKKSFRSAMTSGSAFS